jgi:LDH2 family malate/lactate/ureidoglycolate dehydrogenase
MVPFHGTARILGNNPWSIAIPSDGPAICMDMANTVGARGKIRDAARAGRRLPRGWAVDVSGRPTTDPATALAGALRPMAGHKGFANAVVVELLAAALAGASMLSHVVSPRNKDVRQDIGHLFVAIDVSAMVPIDVFRERVRNYRDELQGAGPQGQIMLPGDPEEESFQYAAENGLAVDLIVQDLYGLAAERGIDLSAQQSANLPSPRAS